MNSQNEMQPEVVQPLWQGAPARHDSCLVNKWGNYGTVGAMQQMSPADKQWEQTLCKGLIYPPQIQSTFVSGGGRKLHFLISLGYKDADN